MLTALVIVFVVAYAAIALEHPLKINKSASALVGAGVMWTIYAMGTADHHVVTHQLGESLMGTAQIAFFLMGAMTIVEVVDAHNGFEVITKRIRTQQLSTLMWLVGLGLMYWISRLWIKTVRGEMHDDPLVYTLRDRSSRLAIATMILCTLAAHLFRVNI